MKKVIPLVIFLVFSLSVSALASTSEEDLGSEEDAASLKNIMFSDMEPGDPYYYAIYFLYNTGVVEGYENEEGLREYRSDQTINRAEFLKIILEGTGMANGASYEACFPDVLGDEWFATYVCQAKEEGFVAGYPDGTFRPEQTINEAEALKILAGVAGWEVEESSSSEDWYQIYLDEGNEMNVVPVEDVSSLMTRGDIAEMIFRNEQVEALPIHEYSDDYIEYFLEEYDIAFDGPFGPGGAFGPGGVYGEEGPFYSGGAFVDSDETFEILGDDFFDEYYCYYGDQEEFYDEILEELSNYSEEELEQLFSSDGGDIYNYGKMYCYEEEITTDAAYFSDELREEYDVYCWLTDVEGEILCYAAPEYGDSSEEEVFSEFVYGEIIQNGPATADGSPIRVTVNLYDEYSLGVTGHDLEAMVMTPGSFYEIQLGEESEGVYIFDLTSYTAATYGIYVLDHDTGEVFESYAHFVPGEVDSIDVLDFLYPSETEDHSAVFDVVLRDAYGNVVLAGEEAMQFSSTLGDLYTTYDEDSGVWAVSLYSYEVGDATVTLAGPDSLSETVDFSFDSVLLGTPRGVVEGDSFTVPVYINMGDAGSLGSYDIQIAYDSGTLAFAEAVDGDASDDFDAPMVSMVGDAIYLNQETSTGAETDQYVHVADLLFDTVIVGSSTIYAEDATLTTTDEEEVARLLADAAAVPPVVVKGTKNVCVHAFVLEGQENTTQADVELDLATAEAMFAAAAARCDCPFFIHFELKFDQIAKEEWQRTTAGAGNDGAAEDEVVENEERKKLATTYGEADCIPVFYVPMIGVDDASIAVGDWATNGSTRSSFPKSSGIDNSRDRDGLTLAHELTHMLSGGAIEDYDPEATDEENADAVDQGAKDPGNIMNYDDMGVGLSVKQCELIEWASYPDAP